MKFYLVVPNSFEGYDTKTTFDSNFKPKQGFGIDLSYFPIDDFMTFDNEYFCSEKLYYSLFNKTTSHSIYNEVELIQEIRMTANANWLDILPSNVVPEKWFHISINGLPFHDDFGIQIIEEFNEVVGNFLMSYLILSEKAVKDLILHHSPNILGIDVSKGNTKQFKVYENEIIENQSNYKLVNQIKSF
jgi:hypothetical protein